MTSAIRPTTTAQIRARLASNLSSGLEMLVGLARSSNSVSSGSALVTCPSRRARLPAQFRAQRGPGAVAAQRLEPAQRVPSGAAVERKGYDLGASANARHRHRAAKT